MDFKKAVEYEKSQKPVAFDDKKYHIIGHNDELVRIREISDNALFTTSFEVRPSSLEEV